MSSVARSRIEYRLLQLVVNAAGDERRTALLVHWDGRALRVAWNGGAIPHELAASAVELRATLRAIATRALAAAAPVVLTDQGLDAVFPVVEGMSTAYVWGPRQVGYSARPAEHFAELAASLRLEAVTGEHAVAALRGGRLRLRHTLRALGEALKQHAADPDRIDVDHRVEALRAYVSPLSWRNGVWHHCVPLRVRAADEVEKDLGRALGLVDVSLPERDVGVLWLVHPAEPAVTDHVVRARDFAERRFGTRVRCLLAPLDRAGVPMTGALQREVLRDVAAHEATRG